MGISRKFNQGSSRADHSCVILAWRCDGSRYPSNTTRGILYVPPTSVSRKEITKLEHTQTPSNFCCAARPTGLRLQR